ncbi:hypothetical protein K503DRAFT_785979 [Rhizopogon vinicolor AM-OR11-026]|uniref:Uncharacterized protein n=1 Tax=Rhizopogon vinicolor AM-OR11-026 TaxID=1314800 RepID=A0A1B7MNH7_9AGAM|nr:hypothetical protein K503DRAFT_785979 [Rhizopogon vinicolor AM-OR11-026]
MPTMPLMAALSKELAALALIPHQFPVSTAGETSVRPLEVTNLNAGNASPYPSLSFDIEQWNFDDEDPPENATGSLHSARGDSNWYFVISWCPPRHHTHGPEWTSTDPALSIVFCREIDGGGWHLMLAATRPLKVLYFDGSSAAKIPEAGVRDVSFLNVVTLGRTGPIGFAYSKSCTPAHGTIATQEIHAVLYLTGLISLYDIALAPSLILVRAGLERCDHRVLGISSEDISQIMTYALPTFLYFEFAEVSPISWV